MKADVVLSVSPDECVDNTDSEVTHTYVHSYIYNSIAYNKAGVMSP